MRRRVGVKTSQPAEFIGVGCDVRYEFGKPAPSLTVLLEAELRWSEHAAAGCGFAAAFLQFSFVLECVQTGHGTFHKEEDDALRPGFEMRLLRKQRALRS